MARGGGAKRRNGYEEYVVPAEGFEPPLPEGKRILSYGSHRPADESQNGVAASVAPLPSIERFE